ncbi:winged helix-turn-helix domain-containing protein [Jonesiaceae bacterium BS-20]|uniref:Winged helix-turn-helix domain-containing protein n=1 Tax=Jonesiaceae bacterium BS-20 TaxID=3120821 RepID=A0AAU7DW19_9MICO
MSTQTQSPASPAAQEVSNQTGFYLWVGVDPARTPAGSEPVGSSQIIEIAEALGELVRELLPSAETHTTLSLSALDSVLQQGGKAPYIAPVQSRQPDSNLGAAQERLAHDPNAQRAPGPRSAQESAQPTRSHEPPQHPQPKPQSSLPNFDFALRPRVTIDLHTRQVIADDEMQRLTYKEFELLAHLVTANGVVVSREELFATVWAGEPSQDSRTIDVHVRRLREKLGLDNHIVTVRGRGYKFAVTDQIDVIGVTAHRELS